MQLMKAAETLDLGDIIEFVRQALEYVSEHPEVTNKDQYLLRIQLSKAAADLLGLLQESKEFYPGVGYDYAPDYPFIIEKNEDKVNLYILGVRTTKFFFQKSKEDGEDFAAGDVGGLPGPSLLSTRRRKTFDLENMIGFIRQALKYVSKHPELINAAADLLGLLQKSKDDDDTKRRKILNLGGLGGLGNMLGGALTWLGNNPQVLQSIAGLLNPGAAGGAGGAQGAAGAQAPAQKQAAAGAGDYDNFYNYNYYYY